MRPTLFIGSTAVGTWLIIVLSAVVFTWVLLLRRTNRLGYPTLGIFYWLSSALVVGFAGAQVFNILIPYFSSGLNPQTREILSTGMTVLGAIVLCTGYSFLYLKFILKVPAWPLMDAAAFSLPLPLFLGRIGCALNGCCLGRLSPDWAQTSPLSLFTMRKDSFAVNTFAYSQLQNIPGSAMLWNFPIMEAVSAIFILFLAEGMYHRRERWRLGDGSVFTITVMTYAFSRFFIEFFRDEILLPWAPINPWQLALLMLFLIFLGLTIWRIRSTDNQHFPPSDSIDGEGVSGRLKMPYVKFGNRRKPR